MSKQLKRITAVALSIAVLISAIVFTGATGNDDLNAEAIDIGYGESYTFDFDEVNSYKLNAGSSTDADGNTFYPFHTNDGNAKAEGSTITVKTDESGSTEKVSALKLSSNGAVQYIPTDKNGIPYVVEPNTKYSVTIDGYVQYATEGQNVHLGGGVINGQQAARSTLWNSSTPGNTSGWYFIGGTQNGKEAHLYSRLLMYSTDPTLHDASLGNMYASETGTTKLSYYTDFDKNNAAQHRIETVSFTTGDFTNNNNGYTADLWQYLKYKDTVSDPYAENSGVTLEHANMGAYFAINIQGSKDIVGYQEVTDEATGEVTRVPTTATNIKTTFYIDSITITKVGHTVPITYDANGGTFSDGSTTKTFTESVGAEFTVESPSYPGNSRGFCGWSLDADGSEILSKVEASFKGTTLYAVWGDPGPHPADGVYDSWGRTIEFDKDENGEYKYVVDKNNTYISGGKAYFEVIDDPDEVGDGFLHYYNHSAASEWAPNWCITPTPTGVSNTDGDEISGQVLPTGSTFKMTMRLRIKSTGGGFPSIAMFYGTTTGRYSNTKNATRTDYATLKSNLTASDDWQEHTVYFTTPDEYPILTNGEEQAAANRLYVGVLCAGYMMEYDLDYIKLEKVTATNLYINNGNGYVLRDTLRGAPGTALNIPEYYGIETYSEYDPTGTVSKVVYGNWYSDENCTEPPVMKFGNYGVDIYCDEVTDVPSVSTENQEMFVGFDTYTQRTDCLNNALITDAHSASGTSSLKAYLSSNKKAAFELSNDYTLDVLEGKTYRVDFVYKADAEVNLGIGTAAGVVKNGVDVKNTVTLPVAANWTSASVVFTADGVADSSVLAAELSASADATVYVDTMIVSSATESVGVEADTTDFGEALRFMLSYTGADNVITMAGNGYTVTEHGVIVKGQEVDTALTIENADAAGVYHFAQTDLSKNWSVNPITGTTVYSAYLNGFEENDDYKVSVRGYVKFSDGIVYYTDTLTASVTDIPAAGDIIPENADLTDYYVYLPAGTTLPADADYTVTTYDSTFNNTSAVDNNTVTEDSYVLFSSMPDFDKINVPSEVKYLVHAGAKAELYYGLNAQVVSEKISSVGSDAVNYLFITDIHFPASPSTKQSISLQNQVTLLTKMANENDNIDFVVVGGDTTTGMFDSKEEAVESTQTALNPLLNCEKPVFVLMGNHDDNSYHLKADSDIREERIISDLDWQNNIINPFLYDKGIEVVQDSERENSKYFYYDLEGKKTRVIALDAIDYEAKYDEDGNILGDTDGDGFIDGLPVKNIDGATDAAKHYAGTSYWGYSADQIRWLAEDALGDLPADYDVIFVSHMGMDMTTNTYNTKVWFGEEVRDIIKAFNAGETYTADLIGVWGDEVSVNADFAGKNGDILSWQFGHQHIELTLYEADVDLFQFCTPSANVGQTGTQTYEALASGSVNRKDLPWRVYTRELDASTEACFNAMSVSSERIYRFTVGQGNNEKLVYPN